MTKDLTPEEWIAKLAPFDRYNERVLMALFAIWGIPKSMLDIGCGTGAMVNLARRLGVEAVGVDQIAREPDTEHDLRKPLNLGRTFQLITCVEVAEHIPKDNSGVFLNNVCSHLARGGRLVFSAAPPAQDGEGHVHCLIEGTDVLAADTLGAMRRFYNGEVITIVTTKGNKLTVTPNHPIATSWGWRQASLLNVGDKVIDNDAGEGIPSCVMPNDIECPSPIEEIFSALHMLSISGLDSVPTTPKDFHGDGMNGEVDIVWTDSELRFGNNATLSEPPHHLYFQSRYAQLLALDCLGELDFLRHGFGLSTNSVAHGGGQSSSLIQAHSFKSQCATLTGCPDGAAYSFDGSRDRAVANTEFGGDLHCGGPIDVFLEDQLSVNSRISLRDISDFNTQRYQPLFDSSKIRMGFLGEFRERFPGPISLDEITELHRSYYIGHVYNLQTKSQAYWANGILTHNCMPAAYWRSQIDERGLTYNEDQTVKLRHAWQWIPMPMQWLVGNTQVFTRD